MRIDRTKVFTSALALYPLFSMYGFGAVSFGDIFLIVALLIGRSPNNERLQDMRTPVHILWLYMFWCSIGIMLNMFRADFLFGAVVKRVVKMGLYLVTISAASDLLDRQRFIRLYRYLVYLTFATLVVQYFAYYALGRIVIIKIPFLPYSGVVTEDVIYSHLVFQFRPGALYAEPASCCYILTPFFAYSLFSRKIKDIFITGLSILMTISSAGIVCLLLILGIYYINLVMTRDISLQRKMLIFASSIILLIVCVSIYSKTPMYYAMERMQRSEGNELLADAVWGKTNAGAALLSELKGWTNWIGMGLGNLSMANLSDYSNSVYYILYCSGYIGIAILLIWVLAVFVNSKNAGKATILAFSALCVASRIFISYFIMIYMVFCLIDGRYLADAEDAEIDCCYGEIGL